jgi:hypothetical protein
VIFIDISLAFLYFLARTQPSLSGAKMLSVPNPPGHAFHRHHANRDRSRGFHPSLREAAAAVVAVSAVGIPLTASAAPYTQATQYTVIANGTVEGAANYQGSVIFYTSYNELSDYLANASNYSAPSTFGSAFFPPTDTGAPHVARPVN